MNHLHEDIIHDHLQLQQNYTKRYYDWDKKAVQWITFLEGALNARR